MKITFDDGSANVDDDDDGGDGDDDNDDDDNDDDDNDDGDKKEEEEDNGDVIELEVSIFAISFNARVFPPRLHRTTASGSFRPLSPSGCCCFSRIVCTMSFSQSRPIYGG